MAEKYNYATPQRPDGTRRLNADMLPIDIAKYINQIKEEEAYHKNGKNAITVYKSAVVTITLIALKQGENLHPGSETNESFMSLQLLEGSLVFQSEDKSIELDDGKMITLNHPQLFNITANKESICLLNIIK